MSTKYAQESIALEVASQLLSIGAIKLNEKEPFTWSSGWKSPIYCDNRLTLSYPTIRSYIKQELAALIKLHYPNAEAIAGVATAGIPQGALVAESLGLPFLYVRSKPKEHGMTNMIEGKATPGQKIVIIEDLVSTGGSSLKAAEALRDTKTEVLGMAAIFSYGFDIADKNFNDAKVALVCLSNYSMMLTKAIEMNYIQKDKLPSLEAWRKDPSVWGK